jgi:thymidylate synthase (FAD)
VDKGIQPVYQLTLADGRTLTVTENHRLLTDDGWLRMREAVGLIDSGPEARMTARCSLMVNGQVRHRDREWLAGQRAAGKSVTEMAEAAGCSYHTIRKWLAIYDLRFTAEDRRGCEPWNKGRSGYRINLKFTVAHRQAGAAA